MTKHHEYNAQWSLCGVRLPGEPARDGKKCKDCKKWLRKRRYARWVEAVTAQQVRFTNAYGSDITMHHIGRVGEPMMVELPPPPGLRRVVWSTVWSLFWKVGVLVSGLALSFLAL